MKMQKWKKTKLTFHLKNIFGKKKIAFWEILKIKRNFFDWSFFYLFFLFSFFSCF
jgi:hypothetical protein